MIGPQRPPKNYDNLTSMIRKAVEEAETANDSMVQWRLSWHYKIWADLAEQEIEEATGATVKEKGKEGTNQNSCGNPCNK